MMKTVLRLLAAMARYMRGAFLVQFVAGLRSHMRRGVELHARRLRDAAGRRPRRSRAP